MTAQSARARDRFTYNQWAADHYLTGKLQAALACEWYWREERSGEWGREVRGLMATLKQCLVLVEELAWIRSRGLVPGECYRRVLQQLLERFDCLSQPPKT